MKSAVEPIAVMMARLGKKVDKYTLAEEAKCHHRTAQRVLRGMHQLGMVYVESWCPIYKQYMPVYAIAPGVDAPRKVLTHEMVLDRAKKARRKKRKDPEVRMQEAYAKRMKRQGEGRVYQPKV